MRPTPNPAHGPRAEALLAEQSRRWAAGGRVTVEELLVAHPELGADRELVLDLIYHEVVHRERAGERPTWAEYVVRFPALAGELSLQFQIDGFLAAPPAPADSTGPSPQAPLDCTGPYLPDAPPEGSHGADLIAGRYQLGTELARGGMGVVHRATDLAFDREVAVKLLNPRLVGTRAADRFVEESRITGQLQHPSIPPVHEVGFLARGNPYLVMKLIRGGTLAERVAAAPRPSRTPVLEPSERDAERELEAIEERDRLLRVFEQICLAVAFAHSRRFIHRDLKPQNVMVGAFGEVQVMDWGLAKCLGPAAPDAPVATSPPEPEFGDGPEGRTRAGEVMGTPAYMPPEQARGENHRVDERADVFTLGGILCAILTGFPPYVGRTGREVWARAAAGDLGDALARLDTVVGAGRFPWLAKKCLSTDPALRFAHAGEVAAAVHDAFVKAEQVRRQGELDLAVTDAEQAERVARYRARGGVVLGLGGFALSAAVLLGLWNYMSIKTASEEQQKIRATAIRAEATKAEFPILCDAISRGIDAGRFAPKWDGDYRGRMYRRLDDTIEHLEPRDKVRAHLIRAAMAEAAQDDSPETDWGKAVQVYQVIAPQRTQFELACEAVRWFGGPLNPGRMERLILAEAVRNIAPVAESKSTPEDVRRRATEALDAAVKVGVKPKKP